MMASDFVRRRADSAPGNKSRFVFFTVHKPLMTNLRPSRLHFLPSPVFREIPLFPPKSDLISNVNSTKS